MLAKPASNNASTPGTFFALGPTTMITAPLPKAPIEILPPAIGSVEERERRLIEAVVALARSLREERDRLASRLREVEFELSRLASRLEAGGGGQAPALQAFGEGASALDAFSDPGTVARAVRPRRPSRTSV